MRSAHLHPVRRWRGPARHPFVDATLPTETTVPSEDLLLFWDRTRENYRVELEITPDPSVKVTGFLTTGSTAMGTHLSTGDLVPRWSHTMARNEKIHLVLTLQYVAATKANVHIVATCRTDTGAVHEDDYDQTYTRTGPDQLHPLVAAT